MKSDVHIAFSPVMVVPPNVGDRHITFGLGGELDLLLDGAPRVSTSVIVPVKISQKKL